MYRCSARAVDVRCRNLVRVCVIHGRCRHVDSVRIAISVESETELTGAGPFGGGSVE
jgi:hypothetical protein